MATVPPFRLIPGFQSVNWAAHSAVALALFAGVSHAQVSQPPVVDPVPEQRRQLERERAIREREEPRVDVQSAPAAGTQSRLPAGEMPCFDINQITLRGDAADRFAWALNSLSGPSSDDSPFGKCLGAEGINVVLQRTQDALIAQGFITSRILAEPQDLKSGTLALTVIPGRIRAIRFAPGTTNRATAANAIPANPGDIPNLRNIEQGLENFKRVPTAEADIKIEPAEGENAKPGESDLVITYSQSNPFRVSLSADDSGSKGTGKFQGNLTVSYDNLLAINDLFYVSLGRDLGGADVGPRGTHARTVHYSVPYGFWLVAATASSSNYFQTVFGASQDYIYKGTSSTAEVKLSRLIYRDASRKTSLALRGFQRRSNNFIDDTEVEVQQRKVGGWEASINHREFLGQASVDGTVSYKRGTGAFNSLAAPEEAFGEGTSRFAVVTADVNVNAPFSLGTQKVRYSGTWRIQNNRTPLTPQDRLAIGGRYSVRGFDGVGSLSAERGWTVRNEISMPLGQSGQEFYTGLDFGRVGGPSSVDLIGKSMAGAVVGLRGVVMGLQYDVFVGAPVRKPEGFKTASRTAGFNLNYSF